MIFVLFSIFLTALDASPATNKPIPVILWHGMGDSCCDPSSLGPVLKLIERNMPDDTYVHSLRIGSTERRECTNSFFMNPNRQVREACKQIANNEKLRGGFNAIGFSQGSQLLRAVAERCPDPPMFNLISLGGQHQGIFGIPHCPPNQNRELCKYLRASLNSGAYMGWVQNRLVQAGYWHDPTHEKKYIKSSIFLADINNERTVNQEYRENLMKLKNFVLVMFARDRMIVPKETQWFGFYTPGQAVNVTKLEDSPLYKEDRIGLKYLNENQRLHFISHPGDHLSFSGAWFIKKIIRPYLR